MNRNREVKLSLVRDNLDWRRLAQQFLGTSGAFGSSLLVPAEVCLTTDADFSFQIRNTYSQPFEKAIASVRSIVPQPIQNAVAAGRVIGAAITGEDAGVINSWVQGIRAYEKTEPINFSLSFSFALGKFGLWDVVKEVMLPALCLTLTSLPSEMSNLITKGPIPSTVSLVASIIRAVRAGGEGREDNGLVEAVFNTIANGVLNDQHSRLYSVQFSSHVELPFLYIRDCTITYGTEMARVAAESGSAQFPTKATITLTFESLKPPAISDTTGTGTNQNPRRFKVW